MAGKLICVVGATGNQGGSVVSTFLKEPGWKIRGLTRNTNSPAAQALAARGVEMVYADLDDITSLTTAFQGANAIFSVLDFWTGLFNLATDSRLKPGQTKLEWAHDYELQQGKNVLAAAAQIQNLERLIFSALSYATKWSGGRYKHVYHFDAEGRAVEYGQQNHPELMKKTSVIQIGMYLTNMLIMPHYQPKKNENGVYVFQTKLRGDSKIPLIATNEDTGPLAKALISAEPGKNLLAFREFMSFNEFAETWGRTLGVKSKFTHVGPNEPWADMPDFIKIDIEEGAAYLDEFGFDGGDPSVIHPKDLDDNIQLDSVADWIAKQDWSAVL